MKKSPIEEKKVNKQEIIYSAIVEKELLHNGLVQREQLKTLKELNLALKDLTDILRKFEKHQFLTIHRSKWKIMLYNLSLGMLFAIGTVLGLMLLSWSTYHFFKDSTTLKNAVDNQLKIRQFDIQTIKDRVKTEIENEVIPKINQNNSNGPEKIPLKQKGTSIKSIQNIAKPKDSQVIKQDNQESLIKNQENTNISLTGTSQTGSSVNN